MADHGELTGLLDDDHPQYLPVDGSRSLSGDWDIGGGRYIKADEIMARVNTTGLKLFYESGVNKGIIVRKDDSLNEIRVGIGVGNPTTATLELGGSSLWSGDFKFVNDNTCSLHWGDDGDFIRHNQFQINNYHVFRIYCDGNENFRIGSNGNAGFFAGNTFRTCRERIDLYDSSGNGAIRIGNTTNTNIGTIRYTGSDFEGYHSGEWKSLTQEGITDHSLLNNLDFASSGHTGFAAESHTHTESDITDLDKYTQSEIDIQMSGKSDVGHTHDDRYYTKTELDAGQLDNRYYTESEIDSALAGKSDVGHTHVEANITDLDKYTQSEIDSQMAGKSDIGHFHDDRYYTETELNAGQLDNRYYTETEIDNQLDSLSAEIDSDINTHNTSTSAHQNLVKIIQCFNDTTTDVNQATAVPIPWNGEDFKDNIFTHSNTTNNTRITFDNEGIYEIQYSINGDSGGNYNTTVGSHIRANGSTALDRGKAYSFSRDVVDDKITCNASLFYQASADDYIEIMCGRQGGSGTVNTIPLQSWISIKLVRYI